MAERGQVGLVVGGLVMVPFTWVVWVFAAETGDRALAVMPVFAAVLGVVYLSLGVAASGRRGGWRRGLATVGLVLAYGEVVAVVGTVVVLLALGNGSGVVVPVGLFLVIGLLNLLFIPAYAREAGARGAGTR